MALTIMRISSFGIVLVAVSICALHSAQAQEQKESLPSSIENRLQEFDPAAVAAARHYYTSPAHKTAVAAIFQKFAEVLQASVERANPRLDPVSKREAFEVIHEAVGARLDLLTDMTMVAALEVFSKDELIALDRFYSSPVGQSIMTKMPKVMGRLPAMMQVLLPLVLEDVRAKLKAKGKELHL